MPFPSEAIENQKREKLLLFTSAYRHISGTRLVLESMLLYQSSLRISEGLQSWLLHVIIPKRIVAPI